jgi:DME family drug/metabolite transporter
MRRAVVDSGPGSSALSGYIYAALAAVLWSFIGPFSKNCFGAGVTPLETAFWRALLGALCFAAQTSLSGSLRIPLRDAAVFFLFGFWGIGVLFGSSQLSIQLSGAAMAMVLMYTAPVWVAVASRVLFQEPVSRRKFVVICIALSGTALACFSGGSLPGEYSLPGIACGLLSGLAYASHFPFYTWWRRRYSTSVIYTYMLLGGTVFLLPFSQFTPDKPWEAWGNLLALGVLTNYAAYIALTRSLRRISQIQAAVIGNLEPVLSTLWVWLFFGENFTLYGWLGCGLVIGSVLLLTTERKSKTSS